MHTKCIYKCASTDINEQVNGVIYFSKLLNGKYQSEIAFLSNSHFASFGSPRLRFYSVTRKPDPSVENLLSRIE